MKKIICSSLIIVMLIFISVGCTTKSLPTSVDGEWALETVTNTSEGKNGEIIIVGKAYNGYDDFNGQKRDVLAMFNEDGIFEIVGLEENLHGEYYIDKELSTKDAISINMDIDNNSQIIATYGIRKYKDDEEVESLIFSLNENTYSFIKVITN